jgi:hypothetical protein
MVYGFFGIDSRLIYYRETYELEMFLGTMIFHDLLSYWHARNLRKTAILLKFRIIYGVLFRDIYSFSLLHLIIAQLKMLKKEFESEEESIHDSKRQRNYIPFSLENNSLNFSNFQFKMF